MPNTSTTRNAAVLAAFGLTGLGIGLLGAMLPALLARWQLSDANGGGLLLAAWGGSTSGTFFARGDLHRAVERATLLVGACLLLLSIASRTAAYPLFVFYGLGLGVMMTGISLLLSQTAAPERREAELNRLNMVWAFGAIASPWVASHALQTLRPAGLLCALAAVFALGALALWLTRAEDTAVVLHAPRWREACMRIPAAFVLASALAVGVESAVGAWLTTYAQRTAQTAVLSISATSALWAGLLLSRALSSGRWLGHVRHAWFTPGRVAFSHGLLVAVSLGLLLTTTHHEALPLLALLMGFGLGPLYPYVLSVALPRFRGNTVFLAAGIGSAVVPWLTGTASSSAGSLRAGLLVPGVGAVVLLTTLLFLGREDAG